MARRVGPLLLEAAEAALEDGDTTTGETPVGFELGLTGAAGPDAAAEALEVLPQSAHTGEVVFELCELHLELSLRRDRVLGENVEDQLSTVDDARVERVLEVSLLHRVELIVHQEALRSRLRKVLLELCDLPLADVRARRRPRPTLHDAADRFDARSARELLHLREFVVGVDSLCQDREDEPALGLGERGIIVQYAPFPPKTRLSRSGRSSSWTSRPPRATRRLSTRTRRRTCRSRSSTTTASRSCTPSARGSRSCSSLGTPTPSRRRGTSPDGSRGAHSTVSARPT